MNNPQQQDTRAQAATFTRLRGLLERYFPQPGKKRVFLRSDWPAIQRALDASTPEAEAITTLRNLIPQYAPSSTTRKAHCQYVQADWSRIQVALTALDVPVTGPRPAIAAVQAPAVQAVRPYI